MRISDWSSDVCSSDLHRPHTRPHRDAAYDHDGAIKPGNPGVAWTGHAFPDQLFRIIGPACRANLAPVPLAHVGRDIPDGVDVEAGKAHQSAQIGRASGREGVCQYGEIRGGAVSLKKKNIVNEYR